MKIDKHSDTWQAVQAWAHSRRQDAVDRLIAANDDKLRGEIRALDELLRQADDTPPATQTPITY